MDIHNTSIHVVIGKYTVRHICHVFDLTESVQCDLSVDAFAVCFRCSCQGVWMKPGAMALTVMPLAQILPAIWYEVDGSLGHVYTREEEYACRPA